MATGTSAPRPGRGASGPAAAGRGRRRRAPRPDRPRSAAAGRSDTSRTPPGPSVEHHRQAARQHHRPQAAPRRAAPPGRAGSSRGRRNRSAPGQPGDQERRRGWYEGCIGMAAAVAAAAKRAQSLIATLARDAGAPPGGRASADCSWPRWCWAGSSPPSKRSSAGRAAAKRRRSSSSSSCPTTSSATGCGRASRDVHRRREFSTAIAINAPGRARRPTSGRSRPASAASSCSATRWCWRCRCRTRRRSASVLEARLNARAPRRHPLPRDQRRRPGLRAGRGAALLPDGGPRFEADLVLVATFVANDAVEAFDAAWRLDGSAAGGRSRATRPSARSGASSAAAWSCRSPGSASTAAPNGCGGAPAPSRPVPATWVAAALRHRRPRVAAAGARARWPRGPRADGARTAIALMPARLQLDPADSSGCARRSSRPPARSRVDVASERFDAALAPLGVPTSTCSRAEAGRRPASSSSTTVHLTPPGTTRSRPRSTPSSRERSAFLEPRRRGARRRLMVFNSAHLSVFFAVVYAVYRRWGTAPRTGCSGAELLLLRRLGLALHRPPGRVDAGQLLGRPRADAPRGLPIGGRIVNSRAALGFLLAVLGFFKYAGFFVDSSARRSRTRWLRHSAVRRSPSFCRSASRSTLSSR